MADLRYALRQLRLHPLFSLVVIATLGLGIGMNAAIFSISKTALRPALPFHEPGELVRIYQVPEAGTPDLSPRSPVLMLVRDNADSFERVAGFRFTDFTLTTPSGPERLIGGVVTPGWLETLGVQPAVGRDFTLDEEAAGRGSQVAVISHGLALREFGTPEQAVGSTLRLNGTPHSVVGVMPEGFAYPYDAQTWVPFRPEESRGGTWSLNIQGRLRPGATVATANQQLANLSDRMEGITPGLNDGMTIVARPLTNTLVEQQGRTALALAAAVGLLLLVACANLANLLLGRAVSREGEFAVRSSLGASRGHLIRQSLTESAALGLAGCVVGVGLAWIAVDLLDPLIPSRLVTLGASAGVDWPTVGFAVGLSLLTAIGLGLVPAMRASRAEPASAMRRGRGSAETRRTRSFGRALVAAELTVTLMLLTGVGLMARDLQRLQGFDLGYDPDGLLLFNVSLDQERYEEAETRARFADRLIGELEATPGIDAASLTTMFPRHRGNTLSDVAREGADPSQPGVPVNHRLVSPGFLASIGVGVVAGRGIESSDLAGALPVTLVSESLAEALWPGEDALGRRLRDRRGNGESAYRTVVGVVSDVLQSDEIEHTWYQPYAQNAFERSAGMPTFIARGGREAGPPTLEVVREALGRVDAELPVFEPVTARTLNYELYARERLGTRIGTLFGAFGLLLATLGVYGSISYAVNRRVREFGVRMALGSGRGRIMRDVLADVARVVAIGAGLGLAGSFVLARVLSAALSEIGSFDPVAFGVALAVLAVAALTAGTIPAYRASRIDPAIALRGE